MLEDDSDPQSTYTGLLTHFIREKDEVAPVSSQNLVREFKEAQKSMDNASKDYKIMMKIHQELKENFQKLVQKRPK